jgi:membrane protein implicated in regulation of membrane protease activity
MGELFVTLAVPIGIIGGVTGFFLGRTVWRRTAARIGPQNAVMLKFEDSSFFILAFVLGFVPEVPAVIFVLMAVYTPILLFGFWWFVLTAWLGHNIAFYHGVLLYERSHGKLRAKRFRYPHHVGAESLIAREGTVLRACEPKGTVKIDATIWKAHSVDGTPLLPGDKAVVRSIKGLTLFVEAAPVERPPERQ